MIYTLIIMETIIRVPENCHSYLLGPHHGTWVVKSQVVWHSTFLNDEMIDVSGSRSARQPHILLFFLIMFFSLQKFILSTNVYSPIFTCFAATFDFRTVSSHQLRERPSSVLVSIIDLLTGFIICSSSSVGLWWLCRIWVRRTALS